MFYSKQNLVLDDSTSDDDIAYCCGIYNDYCYIHVK